jgi:hypothetical protein
LNVFINLLKSTTQTTTNMSGFYDVSVVNADAAVADADAVVGDVGDVGDADYAVVGNLIDDIISGKVCLECLCKSCQCLPLPVEEVFAQDVDANNQFFLEAVLSHPCTLCKEHSTSISYLVDDADLESQCYFYHHVVYCKTCEACPFGSICNFGSWHTPVQPISQ